MSCIGTLVVSLVLITELVPAPRNARRHSRKQICKLADGINLYGFRVPIIIDENMRIVCGHARVEAARMAGLTHVPAFVVTDLTPAQIEAFALFENRISDDASFSTKELGLILQDILELDPGLDLISTTGFEYAEIDLAFAEIDDRIGDGPIEPARRDAPAISRVGDIFVIGNHRICVGDARELTSYEALMEGNKAQLVVCDSPFNAPVTNNVSGKGGTRHGEFVMASGEMSSEEFIAFLATVFQLLVRHSADGSVHFHFMDWRHMSEILAAGSAAYDRLLNLCVWQKSNGSMGSLYRSQHELVFVYKAGSAPHINNVKLGKYGRNRTNVWRYPGANAFGKTRAELVDHPTPKNVDMVADAILDCSNRGDIVLDPFLGSGTTILAAERTGRRGYAIELDPHFVDAAIRRISKATGLTAIHAGSGLSFSELERERSAVVEEVVQ